MVTHTYRYESISGTPHDGARLGRCSLIFQSGVYNSGSQSRPLGSSRGCLRITIPLSVIHREDHSNDLPLLLSAPTEGA